jgi:hypothetical protein
MGQSFTPALSSVGFVRLRVGDGAFNSLGATVYVNIRSDSITGQILASSDAIVMPEAFADFPDFVFPSAVAVTPGHTYYIQPVLQSGDPSFYVRVYNSYNYAGGTALDSGTALPFIDFWFREGIIVPEPSSAVLTLVGGALFVLLRRRKNHPAG